LHHADPEAVELWAPCFGASDVAAVESDLTTQHGGEPIGERMVVTGHIIDDDARPVRGQLVEIWQANASGRYAHKRDQHPARWTRTSPASGDASPTTTAPTASPRSSRARIRRRTITTRGGPHTSISLFGTDFTQRMITQMYFPGDPLFALDPIYQSITDQKARDRLVAVYDHDVTTHEWATGYRWDIALTGGARTPMEAE
jgi:protocatechuate 3,4-dioxygenase beta subunit